MTLRKGEITRARLRRYWPYHVALPADKVRGLDNSEVVDGIRHAIAALTGLLKVLTLRANSSSNQQRS